MVQSMARSHSSENSQQYLHDRLKCSVLDAGCASQTPSALCTFELVWPIANQEAMNSMYGRINVLLVNFILAAGFMALLTACTGAK